jgi:hypothetical protein
MRRFSLRDLCTLPTIQVGHTDNLKIETQNKRIWISRMTVEDGMPYNNQVTVEKLNNGEWTILEQYEAI